MNNQIRKLRLKQGDIVVVQTYETYKRLAAATHNMDLPEGVTYVPVLVAPEGVRKVKLEKLKKIVARLIQEQAPKAEKTFLGEQ
jgi:hypothetical protein